MEDINNIDLNLYRTFLTVAKCGSLSKAAEVLFVSQPAVSYSIKLLEKELNCKLFNRVAKGVELTAEARKLLFYIESAYNTIYTGRKILNESNDIIQGEVRVGVPTHIGVFFLSKCIKKFYREFPGVKFYIVNSSTADMLEMLEKRALDLIVDTYPIESSRNDIKITELMEIENCFVANKKYNVLSDKKIINIKEMRNYPLILPPLRTSTRAALEEIVQDKDVKFDPIIEVPTTEMMLDLVEQGMGIGYFAKPSVVDKIKRNELYEILVDTQLPKSQICVAYMDEFLTSVPRKFIKLLKEETENIINKSKKKLRIVITQDCVYDCKFCHKEGIKSSREKLMTAEDIDYLYNLANRTLGIKKVHITGGEPLGEPILLEMLKNLKYSGASIRLTTNGYLIDENLEFAEYVDKVNISLHSTNKEDYENIVNKKDSYDKVLENIRLLRAKYPLLNICINFVLMKRDADLNYMLNYMTTFSASIKSDLKIIELFPNTSTQFIELRSIIPFLNKLGYKEKKESFRDIVLDNGKHKILLEKCTCSAVSLSDKPGKVCKDNNDIYLSMDGKINLCRNNEENIDLLKYINQRNDEKIEYMLEEVCNKMGNNCKYK